MSILREIMRGVRLDPRSLFDGGLAETQQLLNQSPICMDVSRLVLAGINLTVGEENAKPPYPLVWLEDMHPDGPFVSEDSEKRVQAGTTFGALIQAENQSMSQLRVREILHTARRLGEETYRRLSDIQRIAEQLDCGLWIRGYVARDNARFIVELGQCWIPLDSKGNGFRRANGYVDSEPQLSEGALRAIAVSRNIEKRDINDERAEHNLGVMGSRALIAFSLLNCKNITLQKRDVNVRRNRRHGKTGIEWRVLHIKHGGSKRTTVAATVESDRLTRAHLVRGHFKTYTEDKPLLGHAVGRFWWSPNVRGNPERGAIIKDYEIGK